MFNHAGRGTVLGEILNLQKEQSNSVHNIEDRLLDYVTGGEILVDWLWMSGNIAVKKVQRLLDLKDDGIVGAKTLSALNGSPDRRKLFERIKTERRKYIDEICRLRPANAKFRRGWMTRLDDFKWSACLLLSVTLSLASCKSVSETERLKETKDSLLVESERPTEGRQYSASDQKAEENIQARETENTEIYSVEYDTSARRDSLTGAYPVKKEKRMVRQNSRNNETSRQQALVRLDSAAFSKGEKPRFVSENLRREENRKRPASACMGGFLRRSPPNSLRKSGPLVYCRILLSLMPTYKQKVARQDKIYLIEGLLLYLQQKSLPRLFGTGGYVEPSS